MALGIEPRTEASAFWRFASPVFAVLATMLAGALLFAFLGRDPVVALRAFFVSPLSSVYGLGELGLKATPLVLIAVGLAFGFRAGVWNIGAEGQLTLGAICGGGVALALSGTHAPLALPLVISAGILGGMLWAAIPAFLRARLEVNEILVSLMLSYVALLLLQALVYGPWKDPEGFNFPQSRMFDPAVILEPLWPGTRLHGGAVFALLLVAAAWILDAVGMAAFRLRTLGLAPRAAAYAGFNRRRIVWGTMLASGGLAGLAGVLEVVGPIGQLVPQISPGYGFTAIIVAFLGRLHPLGILLAALLVALSYIGSENAQIEAGLPQAAAGVFQGMLLLFLLAADFFVRYRVRRINTPRRAREIRPWTP